jgi:hypothetical protein
MRSDNKTQRGLPKEATALETCLDLIHDAGEQFWKGTGRLRDGTATRNSGDPTTRPAQTTTLVGVTAERGAKPRTTPPALSSNDPLGEAPATAALKASKRPRGTGRVRCSMNIRILVWHCVGTTFPQ